VTAFPLRFLARRKRLAISVTISLAFGVGANSVFVGLVRAFFFGPLPYPESSELVVFGVQGRDASRKWFLRNADFLEIEHRIGDIATVSAATGNNYEIQDDHGSAEEILGTEMAGNAFSLLGVKALIGRTLGASDDRPDAAPTVVLGYRYWLRRFGGDSLAIGKSLSIDGRTREIVGVMPRGFDFPFNDWSDIWTPLRQTDPPETSPTSCCPVVFARMKPGTRLVDVDVRLGQLPTPAAGKNAIGHESIHSSPMRSMYLSLTNSERPGERTWFGLWLCVAILLLTCANVVGLMVSSNLERRQEIAVRFALGATRRHVLALLGVESLALVLLGTGASLIVNGLTLGALRRAAVDNLPSWIAINSDSFLTMFVIVCGITAGLAANIVPMWMAARTPSFGALRDSQQGDVVKLAQSVREWLVVVETAMAVCFSVITIATISHIRHERAVLAAYRSEHILAALVKPDSLRNAAEARELRSNLEASASAIPGLTRVNSAQLGSIPASYVHALGVNESQGQLTGRITIASVTPSFFRLFNIKITGDTLSGMEWTEPGQRVALLNEAASSLILGSKQVAGNRLRIDSLGIDGDLEILGTVKAERALTSLGTRDVPIVFVSLALDVDWNIAILGIASDAVKVRQLLSGLRMAGVGHPSVISISDLADKQIRDQMYPFFITMPIAVLGLLISGVGILGIAYAAVEGRRREIGIRMALGGTAAVVGISLARQLIRSLAIGSLAGVAMATLLMLYLRTIMPWLTLWDPVAFIGAPVLVMSVGSLSLLGPYTRMKSLKPLEILRDA
jgi:putative ABC transport system permease protein